jgi:hypothetical protein
VLCRQPQLPDAANSSGPRFALLFDEQLSAGYHPRLLLLSNLLDRSSGIEQTFLKSLPYREIQLQSSMIARLLLASLVLFNFSTTIQVRNVLIHRIPMNTYSRLQISRWSPSNALQCWHLISLVFVFASCVQFVIINFLSKRHKIKVHRPRETLSFQVRLDEYSMKPLRNADPTGSCPWNDIA